jgi:hypothetical protein
MGEQQPQVDNYGYADEIAPPPRALKWLIWFLVVVVVLGVIGGGLGVYAFREWVPPRYQVQYSSQFPILSVLLPQRDNTTTLPTPLPTTEGGVSLEDLLGGAAGSVEAPTQAAASDQPPATTATPTTPPPTATPPPTIAPTETTGSAADTTVNTAGAGPGLARPPVSARNYGFEYVRQTWNNCGPANVTMSLSYYGWQESQAYAEGFLRGNREDKNVSPHEIVKFVNEQTQIDALYRIGGDMTTLKRLMAAGFPVMVELGYAPEGSDWLGHYQTVVGYDDAIQSLYVMDSYIPSDLGLPVTYPEFEQDWQQFTWTFIVFHPPEREGEVLSLLGDLSTAEGAYQVALEKAQANARANPQNGFALFNLGRAYTYQGEYELAASAFDRARMQNLPWRMSWYQFEPFRAYYETGRYSDVMALVQSNITTLGGGFVEETFYWQGRALEAQGDRAGAAAAYRRALQQNSRYDEARDALERVS